MAEFFLVIYLGGHGVIMPERYREEQCREAGKTVQLHNAALPLAGVAYACVPAPATGGCVRSNSNGDGTYSVVPCK